MSACRICSVVMQPALYAYVPFLQTEYCVSNLVIMRTTARLAADERERARASWESCSSVIKSRYTCTTYVMALAHLLEVALFGVCLAVGLALNNSSLQTLSNGTSAAASIPWRHSNISSRLSNMEFHCNGDFFGQGLALRSCSNANQQMDFYSQERRTWGPRGVGNFDIGLPRRYISGKATD